MNLSSDPERLCDRLHFVRAFLRDPFSVGAVTPASSSLGDRIGAATRNAARDGVVIGCRSGVTAAHWRPTIVELGSGTGSVSRYLRAMNPVLVERNREWATLLKKRFPDLEIRAECATLALANLNKPVGIVSSIPMLNNPQADAIRRLLMRKYRDGLIRFCVLYTYGWTNPLAGAGFREGRREYFVARNFPPASVWVYR